MNKLNYLKNKKIVFLGFGIENQALIKYLVKKKVKCEMTICDAKSEKQLSEKLQAVFGGKPPLLYRQNPLMKDSAATPTRDSITTDAIPAESFNERLCRNGVDSGDSVVAREVRLQLCKEFNRNLGQYDILFRSPGWPIFCQGVQESLSESGKLSSPMKLFFDLCPTKNIIGVTGTKGKGTTSSLIYSILKNAKKRVWLGGNIGIAPFEFINKIKKGDWVVLELSSFQLEDLTDSPHIAVITNFHKEHLAPADPNNPNYHKSVKAYWDAKANIFKWQNKTDYLVLNFQFSIFNFQSRFNFQFSNYIKNYNGKLFYFKKSDLPSKLIGEHNKENIAAAVEAVKIVGVKEDAIRKAVAEFKGLEHRIEFVKKINGVKYYNDSFATTPEATITALKSFSQPIVLLAGGADKGADFKQFAREIKKRVKFVVLLDGKATQRLNKNLLDVGFNNKKMKLVKNITDAVNLARSKADAGDVIILSTACASFGMFKNYKERGKLFKEKVCLISYYLELQNY